MIAKSIEGSIIKILLKKLRLKKKKCEWDDAGDLNSSEGTKTIYTLLKSIKPSTRIGVSNQKKKLRNQL